jgi:membrane associated rhomboid family serine protease
MWEQTEYDAKPGMGPATKAVLLGTVIAFALQLIVDRSSGGLFTYIFGLTCSGYRPGGVWQFVTYIFLHGSVWHLVLNMLPLAMLGGEMERALGTAKFIALYFVSGIVGGLGWVLLNCDGAGVCIGASGSVFGVIGAFAALFPKRQITLLVMFVLPVTVRAGVLALMLGLVTIVSLIAGDGNVAHGAHLGGGVAGYIYGKRR